MNDIASKLIGIPYGFGKSSFEQCDCLGLMQLYFRLKGWPEDLSDHRPLEPDWFEKEPFRFYKGLCKRFDKTMDLNSLDDGSIVLLDINSESHVLIITSKYKTFITTFPEKEIMGVKQYGKSWGDRLQYYLQDPRVKFVCAFNRKGAKDGGNK